MRHGGEGKVYWKQSNYVCIGTKATIDSDCNTGPKSLFCNTGISIFSDLFKAFRIQKLKLSLWAQIFNVFHILKHQVKM